MTSTPKNPQNSNPTAKTPAPPENTPEAAHAQQTSLEYGISEPAAADHPGAPSAPVGGSAKEPGAAQSGSQSVQQSSREAWDAAFESDDPTVVLSPNDYMQADAADSAQEKTRPISDVNDRADAEPTISWFDESDESSEQDAVEQLRPAVPSTMVTYTSDVVTPQPEPPEPAATEDEIVSYSEDYPRDGEDDARVYGPILTAATASEIQKERYGRLQVIPGLMGWLAALGALQFLLWVTDAVVRQTQGDPHESLDPMVQGLFSGNDSVALWQGVGTGTAYLLAFCVGGYVAGRMARFSSAKQGISVWLWQVVGMAVASALTYVMPQLFSGGAANLSFQWYIQRGTSNAILALALVLCITLIGAVLGGLLGGVYHRRLERYAQNYAEEEF